MIRLCLSLTYISRQYFKNFFHSGIEKGLNEPRKEEHSSYNVKVKQIPRKKRHIAIQNMNNTRQAVESENFRLYFKMTLK